MKKLITALLLLLCMLPLQAQQTEVLNNKSILDMIELGFDEEIIIAKIKSSKTSFDTSIDALKELKNKSISSAIISTMIGATDKKAIPERTGIYVINDQGKEVQIMPTAFSGTKTRSLASSLTYGIASAKIKSILNSPQSKNIINTQTPEFIFCFVPLKENQHAAADWWFRITSSPNEFALIKLRTNKKEREVETGKVNLWVGSDTGVKNTSVVQFDITDQGNGQFKVKTLTPLEKGEYCFYYQGTIPQGGYSNQSVFDFSIQ